MAIQMFARDPDTLTEQFQVHSLSFNSPNKIVNRLVKLRLEEFNAAQIVEQEKWKAMTQASSCALLINVLIEVSDIPSHRHRIDAINILTEFYSQTNEGPPRALVPTPQPSHYDDVGAGEEIDYDAARRLMRKAEPSPNTPALFTNRLVETPVKQPLLDTTELLEEFLCSEDERETISDDILHLLGRTGEPDLQACTGAFGKPFHRGSPRRLEPLETTFGNNPDPYNVPELIHEAQWPELQIFDYRLGSDSGSLRQGHYIYQFISFIRQTASDPGIASLFAIIYRGHQLDNIAGVLSVIQQPPAIDLEVISVQQFMIRAFPQVNIQREEIDRIVTHIDPDNPFPQAIFINSKIFDAIEWGQREGKGISHLLYYAFSTIIYELARYLNAFMIISRPTQMVVDDLDQPQGLHESFESWGGPGDPTFGRSTLFHRGHLPQIVQWLIFGYRLDIDIDMYTRSHHDFVYANFWGGRGSTHFDSVEINSYAASKLLKAQPQIRMQRPELIYFLETTAILETSEKLDNEEDAAPQPQPEPLAEPTVRDVDDLVMSDDEDAYTGQPVVPADSELRNAIRRFRSLRGPKNPPPRPRRRPPKRTVAPVHSLVQQEGTRALMISILCFGVCIGFTYDPWKVAQTPLRQVMENFDELIVPCLAFSLVMVCAVGLGQELRGANKRGLDLG